MNYSRTVLHDAFAVYLTGSKDIHEESLRYSVNNVLQNSRRSEDRALAYFLRANMLTDDDVDVSVQWMDDMARGCFEVDNTRNHQLAAAIYLDYGVELNMRTWYNLAVPALQRALDEAKKEGMVHHQVFALMNLSRAVLRGSDSEATAEQALEYVNEAIGVAKENSEMILYAKAMFALSSCYRDLGLYEEALDVAKETASLMEVQYEDGLREEPVSYYQVARAYLSLNQVDSAIFYAIRELDNPNLRERMSAHKFLGKIYSEYLHDTAEAAAHFEEFSSLQDSVNLLFQNDRVVSDRISLADELLAAKKRRTRVSILLLVLALSGAGVILFALNRRKTNESRETFNMEKEDLKRRLTDSDPLVVELKKKSRYLDDKDWDRILALVDDTYKEFSAELSSRGLTKNNLRLACAVRLGFSTSECADMLGISPASVTKAKQRLKTKLS